MPACGVFEQNGSVMSTLLWGHCLQGAVMGAAGGSRAVVAESEYSETDTAETEDVTAKKRAAGGAVAARGWLRGLGRG